MANIPRGLAEFRDLCMTVKPIWAANPGITLVYRTQAEFAADAQDFSDLFEGRITEGATRPINTRLMESLDEQITLGLPEVKAAIAAKWGAANATAHYNTFGIIHRDDAWIISPDHDERIQALGMMKAAINANALSVFTYDLAFWTNIQTQYIAAFTAANATDGAVSEIIGNRNDIQARLHEVLVSLLLVLKGNYPSTYKNIYRAWGFQPEDY